MSIFNFFGYQIELKDNFNNGASKDKNFSSKPLNEDKPQRKNSRYHTTDLSNSQNKTDLSKNQEESKKDVDTKNINSKGKVEEKADEKTSEREDLKNEPNESFANKKKLGLKVTVKKNHLNENNLSEEINSSDKIDSFMKKKNLEVFINNHPFRNLIFSPSVSESTFKRHLTITYRGLVYSKKCLKGPSESYIRAKQVNLVDSKSKIFFLYKILLIF